MEPIISMYIDDELDIDEKILFVEKISSDQHFSKETLALLRQEILLLGKATDYIPHVDFPAKNKYLRFLHGSTPQWGLAMAAVIMIIITAAYHLLFLPGDSVASYRFVLYQPDVRQVDITGDFSQWQKLPMNRAGDSGYWEINLPLSDGEYRFAYIVDENNQIADPTIQNREMDDFGGENSIIRVEI